jgi:CRISPR system Cascade subunit CasC
MIVEMHIIQNFSPSNLNRDDSNSPKDCEFGGYRRARISSQCIKRSVRNHESFKKTISDSGGVMGVRTKRVIGKIAEILVKQHDKKPDEAQKVSATAIALFGVKRDDKRPDKTSILLYLGENELSDIADIANKNWAALLAGEVSVEENEPAEEPESEAKNKKKPKKTTLTGEQKAIQKALQKVVGEERLKAGSYAADIALFGRMVADKNIKNMSVDAACQVAHAISTNKMEVKMDYFTAVDDLLPNEESGSDMIGIVEFNSSCFYRYSNINLVQLKENLGAVNTDLLSATVRGYVEASVKAVPTGKQSSTAAQNPPGYVRVVVRKDGFPWSLSNAFQKPVFPTKDASLEETSITKLNEYFDKLKDVYGSEIIFDKTCGVCDPSQGKLKTLLDDLKVCLAKEATA